MYNPIEIIHIETKRINRLYNRIDINIWLNNDIAFLCSKKHTSNFAFINFIKTHVSYSSVLIPIRHHWTKQKGDIRMPQTHESSQA